MIGIIRSVNTSTTNLLLWTRQYVIKVVIIKYGIQSLFFFHVLTGIRDTWEIINCLVCQLL